MKVGVSPIAPGACVPALCLCMVMASIPWAAYAGGQGVSGHIGRAVADQRRVNQGSRVSSPVVRPKLSCDVQVDQASGRIDPGDWYVDTHRRQSSGTEASPTACTRRPK